MRQDMTSPLPPEVAEALDAVDRAVQGEALHWSMAETLREAFIAMSAKLQAAEGEVARLRGLEVWRDAVMDGNAVYGALTDYAKRRTGPENVSDTLDAVAVVARAAATGGNANA